MLDHPRSSCIRLACCVLREQKYMYLALCATPLLISLSLTTFKPSLEITKVDTRRPDSSYCFSKTILSCVVSQNLSITVARSPASSCDLRSGNTDRLVASRSALSIARPCIKLHVQSTLQFRDVAALHRERPVPPRLWPNAAMSPCQHSSIQERIPSAPQSARSRANE